MKCVKCNKVFKLQYSQVYYVIWKQCHEKFWGGGGESSTSVNTHNIQKKVEKFWMSGVEMMKIFFLLGETFHIMWEYEQPKDRY